MKRPVCGGKGYDLILLVCKETAVLFASRLAVSVSNKISSVGMSKFSSIIR